MGRIFATSWVPSGFFQSILSASILLCSIGSSATQASSPPCYPAIFSLGDSLSDTGNGALTGNLLFRRPTMPPYGETFPGRPSARFSDGRLLVDFLAAFVGLPSLNPSLNTNADLSRGVNYAVSGATALNATFLASKLVFPLSRLSLEVQLSWHLALKASVDAAGGSAQGIPSSTSFSGGLYVILIGGNDYIGAFQSDYSPSAVIATFVPLVIDKIRSVTEELFASGARSFLFISITPLECLPSVLARYPSASKDSAGCLEDYNSVAKAHGAELLNLVRSLPAAHASGTFMFADYYGAYEFVLENSAARGFRETLNPRPPTATTLSSSATGLAALSPPLFSAAIPTRSSIGTASTSRIASTAKSLTSSSPPALIWIPPTALSPVYNNHGLCVMIKNGKVKVVLNSPTSSSPILLIRNRF